MDVKQQVVDRLIGNNIKRGYHIFADNVDEYTWDFDEAAIVYNSLCKDYDNVRLYEFYETVDEMDVWDGDCLKSKGEFPQ